MLKAFLPFFLLLSLSGWAQVKIQSFVLSAADSSALENVHILILGKGKGTITNSIGSFYLEAEETDKIAFSRLGYASKVYSASDLEKLDKVYLDELVYQLDPVEASDRARIEAFKQKTIYN